MENDKKKYNNLENKLLAISTKTVQLPDSEVKRNNDILKHILNQICEELKKTDELFKAMYTRTFYGGSFYDGLRVGKPSEFDLDLLFKLPKYAEPVITTSNVPGFIQIKLNNYKKFMLQPEAHQRFRNIHMLLDDQDYLTTQKVLSWMEGLIKKALSKFEQRSSDEAVLCIPNYGKFYAKVCKAGPAFTLKITGHSDGSNIEMDIDLVPCFIFDKEKWPAKFRTNPVASKTDFFVVPKSPKGVKTADPVTKYWRLSFQEQEREIIGGKRSLKPAVKLLKKIRDINLHNSIASYYIKTVFLWEVDKKEKEFWNKNSQAYVFMTMLKVYKSYIDNKKIPYYWNANYNLIAGVNPITLTNISNRLNVIIDKIEKNLNNPQILEEFLLTRGERHQFM